MPDLEYYLAQTRRIQEHREAGAEIEIRKTFLSLLKELQGFLGREYADHADEKGELSYGLLQRQSRYARFISEVEEKVIKGTSGYKKSIKNVVNDTYKIAFNGMVDAVKKSDGSKAELEEIFKDVEYVRPETLKNAVDNQVSGLTLNDTLEKNRTDIICNIKQTIGIGLQNGDRYETMAKRIAESLDGDYNKAIRIVRTETHRVREAGSLESTIALNEKLKQGNSGMRYFKVWKTAKDERVRKPKGKNKADHRKMEGITIPVDEYFDLGHGVKTMAPGQSGDAGNDINCRCRLTFKLQKVEEPKKEVEKSAESGIIKEEDIHIGKSLGAAAHRDDVKLPNGQKGKLAEGSKITKIVTFAGKGTNKPVKVAKHLSNQFKGVPESEWKKCRGDGYVEYAKGIIKHVELHWFESEQTGRVRMKVKYEFKK